MKLTSAISNKYFATFCLLLGSIFFVSPAQGKVVTVGCAGAPGGPYNYKTLTAAIQANPAGNVEIDVSGTCTEAVVVAGAQNLSIVGKSGAALRDPGGSPPSFGAVLEIDNSQNVTVQGLLIGVASRTIADAIPGILVQSSDVRIVQDRIEGAGPSDGIDMLQATVRLIGATIIENNNDGQGNGNGVALFGPGSQLLLLNDFSGNCPVLQGNDTGILAGRGGTVVRAPFGRGCVTIQNNAFAAVIANLGATIDLNVPHANPGSVKLLNNLFGLYAQNGSHFILSGPVLIQGNSIDGIRLRTASGALFPSDGASGPTIQGNGSNLHPPCCAPSAGIAVANNGSLDIQAGLVTHNAAPGIIIEDNSSVRLVGPLSITRNPIGVQVTDVSSAAFFLAPSVSGNTRVDVACGPESVAHGDASAVGTSHCPQFRHHREFSADSTRHNKPMP
ncbi:MAG TPA: hypothetical protein VN982_03530 [Candidatus Dormibacteraeota bacterium]|nr:hypothetical protein [Candidatus Dormibacteraeota bacterium]